jgi:hypothetical protein
LLLQVPAAVAVGKVAAAVLADIELLLVFQYLVVLL